MVSEKWASRTGWDEAEWEMWFGTVMQDREMATEFWEKAQEREVMERRAGQVPGVEKKKKKEKTEKRVEKDEENVVGKKKSVFRRLFGGKGGE